MIGMGEKQCRECRKVQDIEQFNRRKDYRDGRNNRCKACVALASRRCYDAKLAAGNRTRQPPEPHWVIPTHTFADGLSCVQLRKWRGPVNHAPMRASL